MPPFIAGKRRRSSSSVSSEAAKPEKRARRRAEKQTLFDAADERPTGSLKANEDFVNGLAESYSDTSLTDVSSIEFEDVEPQTAAKKRKVDHHDDDDEEIDWEDAMDKDQGPKQPSAASQPTGDLELTLDKGSGRASFVTNQKKGPSKIERHIRVLTHGMHVQFLLFHNSMRSRWACDAEVQKILVNQLSATAKKEIETWKLASGQPQDQPDEVAAQPLPTKRAKRGQGRKNEDPRSQRDWGMPAERQENGVANTSRGDPTYRLLKLLAAYWKKRFTITAPSLRKQGYKPLNRLEEELASFKNGKHDPEEHGERIASLETFREHARRCEGSRDVGVQLFVALLRALGLETRLVASLQPVGFGWNKNEEANVKKKRSKKGRPGKIAKEAGADSVMESNPPNPKPKVKAGTQPKIHPRNRQKLSNRNKVSNVHGSKDVPIDLSDSDSSELSSLGENGNDDDDDEVVDVTPSTPRKRPNAPFDRDLVSPSYWAEVISPITHTVYPVDPFILTPSIATKPEHFSVFEPRGSLAENAKQVFAYVIAYSSDGTAKDVTIRYLRKHMWPGRTKGVRLPVEKIPVYNSKGKIKHHEEYNWFKRVMSGYVRPDHMRTAVDDIEDATDLKAVKPEKNRDASKQKEGTLQFYKTSAEYVLERHLRREEAIVPGARPVRYLTTGKGEDKKEEPVFLRKDVMVCRTGESWHKEGRQIKQDQTPMKMVPIRAVTLTRKREVEEAERDGGEKLKQGLYAWDQTEWIIPPPIVDGVIPKNAYGNMDCFVPTMVPEGAVHIPLKSTAKICKRLNIDFAEAVTGFEFGKQRAVPVVQGVVVARENEELVLNEWEKDEVERRIKEEGKREKVALAMWKKLIVGLRIVERVREKYGEEGGEVREERNPFTNKKGGIGAEEGNANGKGGERNGYVDQGDDETAGGFLPDADDSDTAGGFLPEGDEDNIASSSPNENKDFNLEEQEQQSIPQLNGLTTKSPSKHNSSDPENYQFSINGEAPPPLSAAGKPKQTIRTRPAKSHKSHRLHPKHDPRATIQNDHHPTIRASPPQPPQETPKKRSGRPKKSLNENKALPARSKPPRQREDAGRRRSARQSGKEAVVRSRYFDGGDVE